MASFLIKVTGQLINLLALFSTKRAGLVAFKLFATTKSPEPQSEKERALFAAAQATMRRAKYTPLLLFGFEVATHVFEPTSRPSGKTILLVHGWASRIDYLVGLVSPLLAAGHRVVGLDLPGHGRSSGRILTIPLAIEAIDAANRQHGPFDAAIGHSFGGFALVNAVAGGIVDVPAFRPGHLSLIASPATAEAIFAGYSRMMGFSKRARHGLGEAVASITGRPIEAFSAARMLSELPIPTLVIHAEDDKEVHHKAARLYDGAGPHVRLVWLNGLGHRRIATAPETADVILSELSPSVHVLSPELV